MSDSKVYTVIGLMSGTSLDGIDAALIKTDGKLYAEPLSFVTIPYSDKVKNKVRQCFGRKDPRDSDVIEAERLLTFQHAEAVTELLRSVTMSASMIDYIGFHGQTVFHDPDNAQSLQIGDGALLARETGIDVINDFRSADIKAGGQGAPFLPLYHWAKMRAHSCEFPIAVLNIGGVGNVTWIGEGQNDILAFDTGPGNALIDDFVHSKTGANFDDGGMLAASGTPDEAILHDLLGLSYFSMPVPKSLDRNNWDVSAVDFLPAADGAATLSAFTVRSIIAAQKHFPEPPNQWFVAGGGRHNKTIMNGLRDGLTGTVQSVDDLGWNGDALEAEGFAYLAVRSALGLPISLPSTTGVKSPQTGGVLHKAA